MASTPENTETASTKPAAPAAKAIPAKKPAAKRAAPAKPAAIAEKPAATAKPRAATKRTPAAKSVTAADAPAKPLTNADAALKPAESAKPAAPAKTQDTSKNLKQHGEHVERIWDLAKKIGVCMFVTWDGERQRSRPLQANVDKAERAIYFLSDVHSEKDDQVENFPIVTLAFADIPHSKYVSITGKGTVTNDRAKIKELWSPFSQAWWDSADDPRIRVIKVEPQDAELWDSPGRVVSAISMLAAAVTRRPPRVGENAKVKL